MDEQHDNLKDDESTIAPSNGPETLFLQDDNTVEVVSRSSIESSNPPDSDSVSIAGSCSGSSVSTQNSFIAFRTRRVVTTEDIDTLLETREACISQALPTSSTRPNLLEAWKHLRGKPVSVSANVNTQDGKKIPELNGTRPEGTAEFAGVISQSPGRAKTACFESKLADMFGPESWDGNGKRPKPPKELSQVSTSQASL